MENTPVLPPPFEKPHEPADKKDKKDKKKSAEALFSFKKQQAEQDIARSLDKLSLFEKPSEAKSKAEKLDDKFITTRDELQAPAAASEREAPTNELSLVEEQRVMQEIANAHLEDIEDMPEAEALEPAKDFLDKVSDGEDVEVAFNDVASELGLSAEEIAEAIDRPAAELELDTPEEAANESEVTEAAEDEVFVVNAPESADSETLEPQAGSGGRGGSGNGSNTVPPTGSNPNPIPQPQPQPFQPNPNQYPTAASDPNMMPVSTALYYERRAQNRGLLVGSIVGYLIGRRRGRIKTEKRLLPVQKKLEKQVTNLERDITAKEVLLTRLATEKSHLRTSNQRLKREAETRPSAAKKRVVAPIERTQPGRQETRLGLEKPKRAERLGQMAMSAESQETAVPDQRPNNIRQAFRPEQVKTMHRRELLELSEKVIVEGTSLRRIYETHLIGEKQLRHLIGEYLSGKDIRGDLRREMVEREIDFERDPILRDRVRSSLASSASLDQLLESAGALPGEDPEDSRRAKLAVEKAEQAAAKSKRKRQVADAGMIATIIALAAVVAALLIS